MDLTKGHTRKKPRTARSWAVLLGIISLAYILIEFGFNAALVDMASDIHVDKDDLDHMAFIGETLSGIGLAFVLINLIEWQFRTSTRSGAWLNCLLLGALLMVTVPFMHWLQPKIVDTYSESTSGDERRQAMNMNLFKYAAASGAVVFGDTQVGDTAEDKVLLALIGVLARNNDEIHQTLTDSRDNILNRVVLQAAQEQGELQWQQYLQVREGLNSEYQQYLKQVNQYKEALAKAGGQSANALREIREQTSQGYRKYLRDGQSLLNQAGARQSQTLTALITHNESLSNCRSNNCIHSANEKLERELMNIYGFVPPRSDFIATRAATAADGVERKGNHININLFKVVANTISDRTVSEISSSSVAAGYSKHEARLFRDMVGYPRDLTEKQFMQQPAVCSQASAKARSQGISVSPDWCPDDEEAAMAAVDGKARKRIEDEWARKSRESFGEVVSTSLDENRFRNLEAVRKATEERLASASCTAGNAYLSAIQFKAKCIQPGIDERQNELRKRFIASPLDLQPGGVAAEQGKQAVRVLIVPPVAIVFSLFFSLVAALKFLGPLPIKLAGLVLIILGPFAVTTNHGEIATFLGGESAEFGTILTWTLQLEPLVYEFGSIFKVFFP